MTTSTQTFTTLEGKSPRFLLSDQAPVPQHAPTKMPTAPAGEPSKKAAKPAKPRKVEKRQRGRKG